jgi:hypothetical protein
MSTDHLRLQLQPVTARLATIVAIVGKVLRPAAIIGLIATAVIAVSLAPWTFHSTASLVVWCALVVIGVAAALRLLWHGRLLQRTLGQPDYLVQSIGRLGEVSREHSQQLAEQLDHVVSADEGTKTRAAFKMLRNVRNLSALKEMGEASSAIVAPISGPRLVWSGYAVAIVAAASFLAIPVAIGSAIGLLLR